VEASQVHLVSALTNLVQNAFDGFRPRMEQVDRFLVRITCQQRVPGFVDLMIKDNLIGFGAEDLRLIRQFIPGQTPVIVMTDHGNDGPHQSVDCMKMGAAD
jgi:C4-dicarboxylate-specific signal transduction histidine kinase